MNSNRQRIRRAANSGEYSHETATEHEQSACRRILDRGYEKHGDSRTGTLTSAPFLVTQPYGSFLTNGGNFEQTRVELVRKDSGKVFYKTSGTNSETMRRVVVDLRSHLGKEIMVRLVDEHRGGWGHLNFDNFRLHKSRPAKLTTIDGRTRRRRIVVC